ncbi:MAG: Holliday junction branch migration DNA helicase RuvB, partial [Candidatus Omnitrophota bacterium]
MIDQSRQALIKGKAAIRDVKESEEDVVLNISLRPSKLSEFVGHKEMVDNLKIAIQAARERKEPLEHVLLSGPPGLGKTSLAHILAHEMHTKITATSGPAIERAGDLIGILTNLEQGDILFIDEIHRLSKVVEEFLYPAMESFQIDFVIDKGPYAKTIKFNLKPFTLVGATTRTGLLAAPLRGRFGIFYNLDFYKVEDLARIIKHSAKILGLSLDEEAALEVGRRSRGTPRIANRLLRRVRDYAQVLKIDKVTQEVAAKTLDDLGIDKAGLDDLDRRVLKLVLDTYGGGPVGIDSLSASLN